MALEKVLDIETSKEGQSPVCSKMGTAHKQSTDLLQHSLSVPGIHFPGTSQSFGRQESREDVVRHPSVFFLLCVISFLLCHLRTWYPLHSSTEQSLARRFGKPTPQHVSALENWPHLSCCNGVTFGNPQQFLGMFVILDFSDYVLYVNVKIIFMIGIVHVPSCKATRLHSD